MGHPTLSVVVIGRDEGERLKRCLVSIREMRLPDGELELIYVDSRSSDQSPKVAAAAGATVIVLRDGGLTAARARDIGWRKTTAPFVFFVDGDMVVDPDFVRHAMPKFRDTGVAIVFGHTREYCPTASVFHRAFDLHWQRYVQGPAEDCMGGSLIRRSALEAVNGFDPMLVGGEEPDLCGRLRRLNNVILYVDLPMVAHDLAITHWPQYWWRMVRNGYACAEVADRFAIHEMRDLRSRIRHTSVWGTLLILSTVVATASSLISSSSLPALIVSACWAGVVFRGAWTVRHKAANWLNALVFGAHVYLKEIPRLVGQIRYHYDNHTGQRTLIDYKTGSREIRRVAARGAG